jgi:hypothetical protein
MAKKVKLEDHTDAEGHGHWTGVCDVCGAWCIEPTKGLASQSANQHWKEEHSERSVQDQVQEASDPS